MKETLQKIDQAIAMLGDASDELPAGEQGADPYDDAYWDLRHARSLASEAYGRIQELQPKEES